MYIHTHQWDIFNSDYSNFSYHLELLQFLVHHLTPVVV